MSGTGTGSNNAFSYPQLAGPSDIRILDLRPTAEETEAIVCSLRILDLVWLAQLPQYADHKLLPYEALSYTWGDLTFSERIIVNSTDFFVTRNLEFALRALRSSASNRWLWIDQICIDQNNLEERSIQVQLMKDIYANAGNVIVWLGDSNEQSDKAMDLVSRLALSLPIIREEGSSHQITESCFGTRGIPKEVDPSWKYLGELLDRPWFTRVWILQEVALARSATIICGKKQLPWADFLQLSAESSLWPYLKVHISISSLRVGLGMAWGTLDFVEHERRDQPLSGLQNLLMQTRFHSATDSRDKIYGILGLIKDKSAPIPNYTLPIEQLLPEVTRLCINSSGNLDILYSSSSPCKRADLPSWLPDLMQSVFTTPEAVSWDFFDASKGFTASFS